jgi:hypothetical protein
VGGLPVSELNALELEFLRLNNYSLFVTIEELQKYGDNILYHWNQTQDLESLVVKDITNAVQPEETAAIARPFSRLTMKTAAGKSNVNTPTATDAVMDKHWRYNTNGNTRPSFSSSLSAGNTSSSSATAVDTVAGSYT